MKINRGNKDNRGNKKVGNKKVGGKDKDKNIVKNNNTHISNLSTLYTMHCSHTYTIVSYLSSLYPKYTLQQLYLLSPFSPCLIRYYSELIPYLMYNKYLPPEYLYELRNIKRNSDGTHNTKDIDKAIEYYTNNKPSISEYRKYIRNCISTVSNNNKIKIRNSKINKNKYFKLREGWTVNNN